MSTRTSTNGKRTSAVSLLDRSITTNTVNLVDSDSYFYNVTRIVDFVTAKLNNEFIIKF